MRKRVVIGLLAILFFGVLAIILRSPRKGSVEWHKAEYFDAQGDGWFNFFRDVLTKPRGGGSVWSKEDQARMKFHQKALIDVGYLEKRTVTLSNRTAMNVLSSRTFYVGVMALKPEHIRYEIVGTNAIRIVKLKKDVVVPMSKIEQLIRQEDVP